MITVPAAGGLTRRATVRWGGRLLLAARLGWIALAMLVIGLYIAGLPSVWSALHHLCRPEPADCSAGLLDPARAEALRRLGIAKDLYIAGFLALDVLFGAAFFGIAALIFRRASDEPMALFGAAFLLLFGAAYPGNLDNIASYHSSLRLLTASIYYGGVISLPFFFYLFPDGRFVPRWSWLLGLLWSAILIGPSFFPDSALGWARMPLIIYATLLGGGMISIVATQVYRYRKVSDPVARQQTKWVVYGVVVALLGFILIDGGRHVLPPAAMENLLVFSAVQTGYFVLISMIPIALGAAILRFRLWDIDALIGSTLVYGALTISVIALYALVVGALGAMLQARGSFLVALPATALIAVLFQPLRERLQLAVNRMIYGDRHDPYGVLSRLGQRLEMALAPEAVLPAIVESVCQALKLPYAAITLCGEDGPATVAAHGDPVAGPLVLPLVYQQEAVGQLLLAPRAQGEGFGAADRRLLADLARQAGVAAHAVQLTAALQRSRERLVSAREEERRQLRRDLHDGLGPTLASLGLKLAVARRLLPPESAADPVLQEVRDDLRLATADIRRLVYGLRPPALDELGLLGAIRENVASYNDHRGGDEERQGQQIAEPPHIRVEAPDRLPVLPAAVEVAAYRIVQEALTNVTRHAGASNCVVRLSLAAWLLIEVVDDGAGIDPAHHRGVGLHSMRERAEELGGSCRVEPGPAGGTRVLARLPVSAE